MKQNKIVNIDVKIKLNRVPSKKEKRKLIESVASILDHGSEPDDLYILDFGEENSTELTVQHHFVSERKQIKFSS